MSESLITHIDFEDNLSDLMAKVPVVVNAINWLVTSFVTSMMTILNIEARPADPDQPILRELKKSVRTYLRLTFWLKGWSIRKILLRARHRNSVRRAGRTSGTPGVRGSGSEFVEFSNGPNTNSECFNLLN